EARPNRQLKVGVGLEKPFLARVPIGKIPMVGDKTSLTLRHRGFTQITTLQELPEHMIPTAVGHPGLTIWTRANGVDNTPITPYSERKSISTERTFDRDTIDVYRLRSILTAMTENLAFQLRRGEKLTACVSVKLRYSDFQTCSKQMKIPYTSADHILIPA